MIISMPFFHIIKRTRKIQHSYCMLAVIYKLLLWGKKKISFSTSKGDTEHVVNGKAFIEEYFSQFTSLFAFYLFWKTMKNLPTLFYNFQQKNCYSRTSYKDMVKLTEIYANNCNVCCSLTIIKVNLKSYLAKPRKNLNISLPLLQLI